MCDNKPPSSSPPSRASQDPNRRNTQHPNTQQRTQQKLDNQLSTHASTDALPQPHIALPHATAPASRRPGGRRGWWWVRLQEIASTGVQCLWRFARASAREVETTRRDGRDVLEEMSRLQHAIISSRHRNPSIVEDRQIRCPASLESVRVVGLISSRAPTRSACGGERLGRWLGRG